MNKPVTVDEIIEALQDACKMITDAHGGYCLTTYELLADRIQSEGIVPPEGMVLVPIEPTAEMMRAAEEAYMPFGDMGMALICGNLAAAPKQENE